MLHGVCQYMLQLDFTPCFLSHNVEQINLWHIIELTIVNGMRQFISIGKFHTDQKPSWFLSDIRHLINCLHTLCYIDLGIIQLILQMTKSKHLRHYYKKGLMKVNLTMHARSTSRLESIMPA